MHQSIQPPSFYVSLSFCVPPPFLPPQCHYLPPKKDEAYSILLLYVPSKFSPASTFSTLNTLSLCLCLSHSLFATPPSLSPSLFLPFPSPPSVPLTPHTLLLHSLPVNLPTLLPSLSHSVCSCITYHPDPFPTSIIGASLQQMLARFI